MPTRKPYTAGDCVPMDCPTCGRSFLPIDPVRIGKAGPPRRFCAPECAALRQTMRRLSRLLDTVQEHATPGAWSRLRADCVALTNGRAVNRGVPRKRKAVVLDTAG